jgi:predicted RNase H-like HicB family nuclease
MELFIRMDYSESMLTQYIQAAMREAKCEILEGDEGFYGEIPGFQGVYSNAKTLSKCRDMLQEVLEGWILLHVADNTPLPKVAGIRLQFSKPRGWAPRSSPRADSLRPAKMD